MQKPDYLKMRLMLAEGRSESVKKDYMNLSDEDTIYEFIKDFGEYKIPKEDV